MSYTGDENSYPRFIDYVIRINKKKAIKIIRLTNCDLIKSHKASLPNDQSSSQRTFLKKKSRRLSTKNYERFVKTPPDKKFTPALSRKPVTVLT